MPNGKAMDACFACLLKCTTDNIHYIYIGYIYIYTCYPPHKSTFFTVFFLLPQYPPWSTFLAEDMLSYLVVKDKERNIGKMEIKKFSKHFGLKKHVVTGKCCLQVTNLPWSQDIPWNKNHYSRKKDYNVWKDAIHSLMKLSLPLISLVWPWFLFFDEVHRGNRVRKMLWSNIV